MLTFIYNTNLLHVIYFSFAFQYRLMGPIMHAFVLLDGKDPTVHSVDPTGNALIRILLLWIQKEMLVFQHAYYLTNVFVMRLQQHLILPDIVICPI